MSRARPSETGSRASTEPCSTVSALTGFDPARLAERERVVAWLNYHAVENRKAADTPFHSSSPARTIDLRARANSCAMHAHWIRLGKHLTGDKIAPEPFSDALTRLEAENDQLRAALEPFAAACRNCIDDEPDRTSAWESAVAMEVTFGDFRRAASVIEAATAGETGNTDSTEGESAVAKPDAQTPPGTSDD